MNSHLRNPRAAEVSLSNAMGRSRSLSWLLATVASIQCHIMRCERCLSPALCPEFGMSETDEGVRENRPTLLLCRTLNWCLSLVTKKQRRSQLGYPRSKYQDQTCLFKGTLVCTSYNIFIKYCNSWGGAYDRDRLTHVCHFIKIIFESLLKEFRLCLCGVACLRPWMQEKQDASCFFLPSGKGCGPAYTQAKRLTF